ncbi:MAG: response regulator transcription factor [Azospirillaceae bacterium]
MKGANVRTILVGGDSLFREGLKRLLVDTPVSVIGEADGADGAATGADEVPELAILLEFADEDALGEAIEALRRDHAGIRVVVVAGAADSGRFARALAAGVDGYLLRDISKAALVQSIGLVMLGENILPTRLTADMMAGRGLPQGGAVVTPPVPAKLTDREKNILRCLVEGHQNKVIAKQLAVTEATVKVQVRRLLSKIGAANRTQAAIWAIKQVEDGGFDGFDADDESTDPTEPLGAPALAN